MHGSHLWLSSVEVQAESACVFSDVRTRRSLQLSLQSFSLFSNLASSESCMDEHFSAVAIALLLVLVAIQLRAKTGLECTDLHLPLVVLGGAQDMLVLL
jgi:hypothetical protein